MDLDETLEKAESKKRDSPITRIYLVCPSCKKSSIFTYTGTQKSLDDKNYDIYICFICDYIISKENLNKNPNPQS